MINLSTGAFYERSTSQIGGLRAQAETLQQQIGAQPPVGTEAASHGERYVEGALLAQGRNR